MPYPTPAKFHTMTFEHFDVLIIGAGLSGVGAGVHLQKHCPGRSYAILEGRESIDEEERGAMRQYIDRDW